MKSNNLKREIFQQIIDSLDNIKYKILSYGIRDKTTFNPIFQIIFKIRTNNK